MHGLSFLASIQESGSGIVVLHIAAQCFRILYSSSINALLCVCVRQQTEVWIVCFVGHLLPTYSVLQLVSVTADAPVGHRLVFYFEGILIPLFVIYQQQYTFFFTQCL